MVWPSKYWVSVIVLWLYAATTLAQTPDQVQLLLFDEQNLKLSVGTSSNIYPGYHAHLVVLEYSYPKTLTHSVADISAKQVSQNESNWKVEHIINNNFFYPGRKYLLFTLEKLLPTAQENFRSLILVSDMSEKDQIKNNALLGYQLEKKEISQRYASLNLNLNQPVNLRVPPHLVWKEWEEFRIYNDEEWMIHKTIQEKSDNKTSNASQQEQQRKFKMMIQNYLRQTYQAD